jgi:hypothetical protein
MSDPNVEFCRELLRLARRDAKTFNVEIPKGLVALRSGFRDQWFVQGKDGDEGLYVMGDNGYEARAKYIEKRTREAHPQYEQELESEAGL